jgi:hypothetical protein
MTTTRTASPHFVKHCQSKETFLTFGDAMKNAQSIFNRSKEVVYPYPCDYCKWFHVGHYGIDAEERERIRQEVCARLNAVPARAAAAKAARRAKKQERREEAERIHGIAQARKIIKTANVKQNTVMRFIKVLKDIRKQKERQL